MLTYLHVLIHTSYLRTFVYAQGLTRLHDFMCNFLHANMLACLLFLGEPCKLLISIEVNVVVVGGGGGKAMLSCPQIA